MTATHSVRIYELLVSQFGKPEQAREVTDAIVSMVDEKVEKGNKQYEALLNKDLELLRGETRELAATLRGEMAGLEGRLRAEMKEQKADILKAVYVVGIVQFVALLGGLLGIVAFMAKYLD